MSAKPNPFASDDLVNRRANVLPSHENTSAETLQNSARSVPRPGLVGEGTFEPFQDKNGAERGSICRLPHTTAVPAEPAAEIAESAPSAPLTTGSFCRWGDEKGVRSLFRLRLHTNPKRERGPPDAVFLAGASGWYDRSEKGVRNQ
jgi:hypothetical protein